MKPVYFMAGWFFFLLGIIGIVLPVVPTTPFMLLALWGFSKSSERFHFWLYHHKFFGPPLQQWTQYHVIPLVAKVVSISMMGCSFLYLVFFRDLHIGIIIGVALFMLYSMWFILTKPSSPTHGTVIQHADKTDP